MKSPDRDADADDADPAEADRDPRPARQPARRGRRGASSPARGARRCCARPRCARKDERRIQMGMSIAKFPFVRTLDGFDFDAQPSLDPKQIRELATCRWVANGDSAAAARPARRRQDASGGGARPRGHRARLLVLFATGDRRWSPQLAKAHAEGRLEDKLLHFAKPKLLIIDELGYLPFEPDAAHLFFQLVSRRYERGSDAGHQQPHRGRVGQRVRRCRGRHRHPRPAAAPQPRPHHPRRQLPAARKAPVRAAQARGSAATSN